MKGCVRMIIDNNEDDNDNKHRWTIRVYIDVHDV